MARIFLRLLLGGLTGKVLGLVREVVLAALFGAGRVVAAQRVALTATFVPVNFFTADALSAGFLPLYVKYRQEDPAMAVALYRAVRSLLAAFSVALTAALLIGRHQWVGLLAPGLDSGTAGTAAAMLGIAALGVPFYVQYSVYTLVGLAHDEVRLINLRASFQSVGLICGTVVAYLSGQVALLAWGFTIPYALLCGWGAYWVRRRGYLRTGEDVGRGPLPANAAAVALGMFWRRLRPLLLIPVILQGSIAVERIVGSFLGVTVVAATEYARFVVDSCMALVAAPLGLAGLTAFAKKGRDEVADGLRQLLPPVLLLTIPLSLMLCLNSRGIVTVLYARGEFDARAVDTASVMLLGFSLGIWAQVIGYTLIKVLNARGANRQVAIVMAVAFSAAIAVNLLLYRAWGAFTLGAASSVCGLLMFAISARLLGVLRDSVSLILALAPGALVAAVAGYVLRGPGLARLAASCAAILVAWACYVALVPRLRRMFLSDFLAWMRRLQRGGVPPSRSTSAGVVSNTGTSSQSDQLSM